MRNDALLTRFELFTAAAVIAAHANYNEQGFRQKDVRFIINLFANWLGHTMEEARLPIKNTQIQRYLETLVKEASAKRNLRGGTPYYRLTRAGLIELLSRVVNRKYYLSLDYFFFRFYFLHNYKPIIMDLVKKESKLFPFSIKVEIEALLDTKELVKTEMKEVEKELLKLRNVSIEAERSSDYALNLYKKGLKHSVVAEEMERRYPYSLNSQKPLSKLLSEIPTPIGQFELTAGAKARNAQIWQPALAILNAYYNELKKLQSIG